MSDIQVGDRVRVVRGTAPYPGGTEFTVTEVVPNLGGELAWGRKHLHGYADPVRGSDPGIWINFVEKIPALPRVPEVTPTPSVEESLAAISNTLISIGWALDRIANAQDGIFAQGARR